MDCQSDPAAHRIVDVMPIELLYQSPEFIVKVHLSAPIDDRHGIRRFGQYQVEKGFVRDRINRARCMLETLNAHRLEEREMRTASSGDENG
jgi:hypothetical protein